jgi:hypothetical protein
MLSLLYWIIWVVLESTWKVHQQKSLKSSDNLSQNLFKMYSHIIWVIFFLSLLLFLPYETSLLRDYHILGIIIIVAIARILNQNFELSILKKTKLSYLLPYENLDKIFIVIFWYILYHFIGWTEVSLITMWIVCLTFVLVLWFSINIKNLKFPRTVILFIIAMAIRAWIMISTAYVLFEYSSITYWVTQIILTIFIAVLLSLLLRDNFKLLYKQNNTFYKHRFIAVCLGQIWFLLSLLIIESAGVIVASLLGFLAIIAKIISMKIILNESPTNKQISLSLLVVVLIWIGLYFK